MTRFASSANIAELRESATIAASSRAKALRAAGREIIDLGAGEPDFSTPDYVKAAAHRALDEGATRYTQVEGLLALRERIAARAGAMHGATISADQVMVTAGTKQALFNACFSLFSPGDEVLVPTPGWTSYYEMVALARAIPIAVRGARERQLKVCAADLERAATSRTRGLILNSPTNPTGAVYSRVELEAIVRCAADNGWWILSDEIYRAISYDAEAASLLSVARDLDRVVVVDGVAKSFAMTGWRIGWSIAPSDVTRAMTALQSHTTSNAGTLAQHAVLAALGDDRLASAAIDTMVVAFRARRDRALALLRDAGADVIEPHGAFYLFVRVGSATAEQPEPGTEFSRRLLDEFGVAVVPGIAFRAPEWVRLSYAAPIEQVEEGVRRMIAAGI
jgi:aspartate aminotransferase